MNMKALCIGINQYANMDNDLAGCVNDANDWNDALTARGFKVAMLLDERATRANILGEMRQLLEAAKRGDVVVISYSGHGSWIPDLDNDEEDGRDEVFCPHDVRINGPISDDVLFQLFVDSIRRGVHAVFIADSCHSGTLGRFASIGAEDVPAVKQRSRFLPPESFLSDSQLTRARTVELNVSRSASRPSPTLVMSASDPIQKAYETDFNNRPNGAFTYFALRTLKDLPAGASYREWHEQIRTFLPNQAWDQTPGLSGTVTQKERAIFGSGGGAPRAMPRDLWEMVLTAQPGSQLDLSGLDPREAVLAVEAFAQPRVQAPVRPRDDEFPLGNHVIVHMDWWGPFPGIAGLARIEIDQVALDAGGRAFTLANLARVGVPIAAAIIISGAIEMIRATSAGNGVDVFVQIPSLVHFYLPR